MKRCKRITCWTDYPFEELGDAEHQLAPIRRVRVLSYDQDKYATVEVLGYDFVTTIKAGYLYRHEGRHGLVKTVNRRKLERMICQDGGDWFPDGQPDWHREQAKKARAISQYYEDRARSGQAALAR